MKRVARWMLIFSLVFLSSLFSFSQPPDETEARLLRFPAVYEDQVVFSYAGDLYSVARSGGTARKITNHNGYEVFPRFSPDGKFITFTGQYDGNTEVYLMDARGGVPRRLTYTPSLSRDDVSDRMGPNNIAMGWKHDSKHIVFRSRMHNLDPFVGQLFITDTDGGMHRQLPLPRGGFCSFSPDDKKLAYNRVFREFRSWKRYRGGMADDVWIYDFASKKTTNITHHPAQDIIPMWKDHNIYFLSDRGPHERMNLYVYDTNTAKTRRLTDFDQFDIKFPSLGKTAIAFENGGYIYLFDTHTEKAAKLTVHIREDRLHARGGIKKVKKNITGYHLSPKGKRALFGARGEVFTVPGKYGNTLNLTRTSGVHERNSRWSPDGKRIAFVSDQSGEDEIYITSPDGKSKPLRLTTGGDSYKFELRWSRDSKKILWSDRKFRLRTVDIDTKAVTEVARSDVSGIRSFDWSPDSRWIAYAKTEANTFGRIYLYSMDSGKNYPVTDRWYRADAPVFSSDGKYLFFISSRDFNPLQGVGEFRFTFSDMERIYLVTLAKSTPSPFKPKSDDETGATTVPAPAVSRKKTKKTAAKAPGVTPLKVDTAGISQRVIGLPISPSDYKDLASVKNKLYYLRKGTKDKKDLLLMFDLDKQKETDLGPVSGYRVSADLKKMLLVKDDPNAEDETPPGDRTYAIIPLPAGKPAIKAPLNLDHLEMELCLKCEWKNIFHDCWRHMRDYFYVANMHGVGWEKMRKRYEPLLAHVNHRNDLTYVIAELLGELNVGHAYVGGGERPEPRKVKVGQLGAELERDAKTGYYRIKKILRGQNWDKTMVSPLTAVGVNVSEGDYITAINGVSTGGMKNPYKALNNTVGRQVLLTLNAAPSGKGGRDEVVVPIEDVRYLYYYNWVHGNIAKVDKATGGKAGYLHIPDMDLEGMVAFVKLYQPQLRKKALIIDVRGNGGGYVSELIIERLRREFVMMDIRRGSIPTLNPIDMMYGPMVCLIDEFSASDGDIFPYRFKKYKMGKLIGKRTWGGVVGIDPSLPLLDGGTISKPEYASYDEAGKKWLIEGHGVEPDMVVDNDPANEFDGIDHQLNKAVNVILQQLKTGEKSIPAPPPDPDKSIKKH
ncbi:MAG: protease [bacterium]|nr:protease [bacterium]